MEDEGPLYPADFYRSPPNVLASLEPLPCAAWRAPIAVQQQTPFFAAFRRLALMCKWSGCFPVKISNSSSQLSFSWRSLAAIVSSILPVFEFAFIAPWGLPFDPVIMVVILTHIVVSLIIRFMFFSKIPILIDLVQLFDELQDTDIFKDVDSKISNKVNIIITTLVLSWMAMVPLSGRIGFSFYPMAAFLVIPMTICSFLYALCYQLAGLWDRLEREIAGLTHHRCSEPLIEHHRIAHVRLLSCVRLIDDVFGNWLAIIYIFFSVNLVYEFYTLIYVVDNWMEPLHSFMTVAIMPFIYYPAVIINRFQDRNKMILGHLFKMALNTRSDNELFQIVYFQRQVEMNEATISAAGLANVNKEIIPKALSLFASFFIAAIQIAPQIRTVVDAWRHGYQ